MEPQILNGDAQRPKRRFPVSGVAALGVGSVLVGLLAWLAIQHLREEPPPPPPAVHLAFPVPPGAELWSDDDAFDAAISPDETQMVFVAVTDGAPRLWRRVLDGDDAAMLTGTEGARLPAWKRSGNAVSFFANGKLQQIALSDGVTRDLAEAPSPAGATWLADGSLLFAPTQQGPLQRLRNGIRSDATTLMPGDRGHVFPASAGSDDFTYIALREDGRKRVRLVVNGQQHELATTSGHAQLVGEHLLHVRDGVLLAERIDPETMAVAGRATPLAASAGVSASGHAAFAASSRLLIVAPSVPPVREIVWFDEMGRRIGTVGEPGDYRQIRLSPDDRDVAVTMTDPLLKTLDVTIMPMGRPGDRERLTLALAADSDPVWSPDASRVVFRSMEDGKPKLFTRRAHDADAPIDAGPVSDTNDTATDWRAGKLLVTSQGSGNSSDIRVVDAASGERAVVAGTGFNETDGRWSPDGGSVAYVSNESGQPDVYVIKGGQRTRVSFAGGMKPRWGADGRSLFFLRRTQVMRADVDGSRFGDPRALFEVAGIRDIDVSWRSRRLLVLLSTRPDRVSPMTIVNWPTRLAALPGGP